jgi:hypothetical protein
MVRNPTAPTVSSDFREVNKQTASSYIMPASDASLRRFAAQSLHQGQFLASGTSAMPEDVHKTRFITAHGAYEWLRMPLASLALQLQQRFTDMFLRDIAGADDSWTTAFAGGDADFEAQMCTSETSSVSCRRYNVKPASKLLLRRDEARPHSSARTALHQCRSRRLIRALPIPTSRAPSVQLPRHGGHWSEFILLCHHRPATRAQQAGVSFVCSHKHEEVRQKTA